MFVASVDDFGRAIGGVGVAEVDQDVPGSALECPAQRDERGQTPRYARGGQRVDSARIMALPAAVSGAR